jgi:hypothetical protein
MNLVWGCPFADTQSSHYCRVAVIITLRFSIAGTRCKLSFSSPVSSVPTKESSFEHRRTHTSVKRTWRIREGGFPCPTVTSQRKCPLGSAVETERVWGTLLYKDTMSGRRPGDDTTVPLYGNAATSTAAVLAVGRISGITTGS